MTPLRGGSSPSPFFTGERLAARPVRARSLLGLLGGWGLLLALAGFAPAVEEPPGAAGGSPLTATEVLSSIVSDVHKVVTTHATKALRDAASRLAATADSPGGGEAPGGPPRRDSRDNDPSHPLSPGAREILAAIRHDPPPESIIRETHYWRSNEQAHEVWAEHIDGLGGAYVGVGADQNYVLAGWARPSLMILMDFDMGIVNLHRLYHAAFVLAPTPADFMAVWRGPPEVLLSKAESLYPHERQAELRYASRAATWRVRQQLGRVRARHLSLKIASILTDEAQYAHVRDLWLNGRITAVRGDLTGPHTMLDIAVALDKLGIPLNTLYLSNAEQYFSFGSGYRRNIAALPFGERGCLLRTAHTKHYDQPSDEPFYHFSMQSGANARMWMLYGYPKRFWQLYKYRTLTATTGLSEIRLLPPSPGEPRIIPETLPSGEESALLRARLLQPLLPDFDELRCGVRGD